MGKRHAWDLSRREAIRLAAGMAWMGWAIPEGMPEPAQPRAISGDDAIEPDWTERFTVTVGVSEGDIAGGTDRAIQAAVDYVAEKGGGTVRILPGTYRMRNAVTLRSGVRLLGSGPETVLFKEPSVETALSEDSDWYDQEITLENASGFQVGDGVCIRAVNPHTGGPTVINRTLIARDGNRFKLDRGLRENVWMDGKPKVESLFPLLTAEYTNDLVIEELCLDGNRANNANLDGNYAGCIWLQDCSRIHIRKVLARDYNGDGMSWQICHDVLAEECESRGHAGLGMHPGSGSQRTAMRNNLLEDNDIGIFFCWGVRYGLAEKNRVLASRSTGISIGHRDHYNIIRDNEVLNSGQTGILFRPERGAGFTASGNRVEGNRVVDSGPESGVAIDVQGETRGNTLARNVLLETRGPASRIGIRLSETARENTLEDNRIEGFAAPVEGAAS